MSSDFYPACLSRNLVRTATSEYRENADCPSRPDDALAERRRDPVTASFMAFPDFGGKRTKAVFGSIHTVSITLLRNVLRPVH